MNTPVTAAARRATLWIHLLVHTGGDLLAAFNTVRRTRQTGWQKLRGMCRGVGYHVAAAIDPRETFGADGDFTGRRRRDLDPAARPVRRRLRDLRRRRAGMLLAALGTTGDAVAAKLTRCWQRRRGDTIRPIEEYLAERLDPHAARWVEVGPWATSVGGTWVATPAPVRRYLRRHARRHEQQLWHAQSATRRRGRRPTPADLTC